MSDPKAARALAEELRRLSEDHGEDWLERGVVAAHIEKLVSEHMPLLLASLDLAAESGELSRYTCSEPMRRALSALASAEAGTDLVQRNRVDGLPDPVVDADDGL